MTELMHNGDRLRILRKARGLTQEQLGDALGLNPTTITQWERQLRHVPPKWYRRLAEVLAVPEEQLHEKWAGEPSLPAKPPPTSLQVSPSEYALVRLFRRIPPDLREKHLGLLYMSVEIEEAANSDGDQSQAFVAPVTGPQRVA